jgi:glycosyltransferase involved in cell wall biosynthesis
MRVSVVIAAFNAMPYFRDALESIAAQTVHPFEVIVVNGPSTDETADVARSYGATVVPETTRGFANAWNDGIRAAQGDAIALLDSDDVWPAQKLERQIAWLEAHAEAGGVIGHIEFFLEPGRQMPSGFKPELLHTQPVGPLPGALVARRSVFDTVGLFGSEWTIAGDVDWFARVKDAGIVLGTLPEVVLRKRVHDRNLSYLTAKTPAINNELLALLHQSIRRQRTRS